MDDARLNSPSLVALAVDSIRRRILASELQPGERLLEDRLTQELGISRPPLREALRLLENEGLVITRPRRGSVVVALTKEDCSEIVTLGFLLERAAFEHGIPVRDPAVLDRARHALADMERQARLRDREALVAAGLAFHSGLLDIAENDRLSKIFASVQQQLTLCISQKLIAPQLTTEDYKDHVSRHSILLDVVIARDALVAVAELTRHYERAFGADAIRLTPGTPSLCRADVDSGHGHSQRHP